MQAATRLEQGWVSQMQNAALGNMADQVPPLVPGVEIEEGKVPQWGSGSAGAFCRYVCITPSPDLSPSLCLCQVKSKSNYKSMSMSMSSLSLIISLCLCQV